MTGVAAPVVALDARLHHVVERLADLTHRNGAAGLIDREMLILADEIRRRLPQLPKAPR